MKPAMSAEDATPARSAEDATSATAEDATSAMAEGAASAPVMNGRLHRPIDRSISQTLVSTLAPVQR